MKIADEIRKQLEKTYKEGYAFYGTYQFDDTLLPNKEMKKVIDQALKEILKLKVKLPEKKKIDDCIECRWCRSEEYNDNVGSQECVFQKEFGYNQALSDVAKLNEE